MRKIDVNQIIDLTAELVIEACIILPTDVKAAIEAGRQQESSTMAKNILSILVENAELAQKNKLPICQDTGVPVVFVEIGQDLELVGGTLKEAINQGIRVGSKKGYLRTSMVNDPIRRANTGDNTPAIIFSEQVAGDKIKITVAPKGAGCENMSRSKMLKPADGREGIKNFVVETVLQSGANACPPLVIGVGIGGGFSYSTILAKKAFLRTLGQRNPDSLYAELEEEIKAELNASGLGPQALGGMTTALDVLIEQSPCHIASLPVAVCINCHATRHASATI